MYRILCESYNNYMDILRKTDADCYRHTVMLPLQLLTDVELYDTEKLMCSPNYKKANDFIFYIKNNLEKFPRLKALLWTLESRGMVGQQHNLVSENDLEEMAKTVQMFLKLVYWV